MLRKVTLILAGSILVLGGCKPNMSLLDATKYPKIALISFSADRTIGWEDEDDKGVASNVQSTIGTFKALAKGKSLSEAAEAGEHSSQAPLDQCQSVFFTISNQENLFKFADTNEILSSPSYTALKGDKLYSCNVYPNYKKFDNNEEELGKTATALNVDAVATINISFTKRIKYGSSMGGVGGGSAEALAHVSLKIVDKNGKEVVYESSGAGSDDVTAMITGGYDHAKMETMCVQAFNNAVKEIYSDLKKEIAKLNKT